VRVTFSIAENQQVVITGTVVRMEIVKDAVLRYLIGIKGDNIDNETITKINKFIGKINLYGILDKIDLTNVVDLHLVAGCPPILKRVGRLERVGEPLDEYTLRTILINMLDEARYKKFSTEKDVNFVFSHKDKRLRANIHYQQGKIEGVFRLLASHVRLPSQLGLPSVVERILEEKRGLILVSGRTGSGKTTTLASMVELLNNHREGIIICIEDPIECLHTNKKCIIKQREVGRDTTSFSSAVKNALRQNPDVLVIGEILDGQTMDIALTAAESGTLVLTSIHASDSGQALDRMVSFFPPDMQRHILARLSLVLKGIVAQELLPRLDEASFVPAVEVLVVSDALRKIIRDGDWRQIPTIVQTGRHLGMQSLQESLEQLVHMGAIDPLYLKDLHE
jgi:twitching motility protein PilT